MEINFEEQVKLLVELQGLDAQIFRLQDELDFIPEKISQMDEAFNEKAANLKRLEDNVKMLQVKRNEKEVDLQTKENTIKKYTSQMYQVKTNKEYTALQEEIGRVKADNSIIEEDIIKILDQIDAENSQMVKERDFLKKEEVVLGEEKKRLNEDGVRAKAELEKLNGQRAELAVKVEKAILAKYDRILKNKVGLAVVPVMNDSCQGCYRILPPQVVNEVRMKSALILCDSCARILYIEE